jgi:hypothetical protein
MRVNPGVHRRRQFTVIPPLLVLARTSLSTSESIVRSMPQRRREREAGLVDRGSEYLTHLVWTGARDRLSTTLNESYV